MDRLLRQRETGLYAPNTRILFQRKIYPYICPTKIIPTIEKRIVIKKFTPDGKYLIAFESPNIVKIYTYTHQSQTLSHHLESITDPFNFLFTEKYSIHLGSGQAIISWHTLAFSFDKKFIICVTANPSSTITFTQINQLDDITFYIICIATGMITDSVTFWSDFICLKDNGGFTMTESILAITSLQNQCIHLFHLTDTGRLVKMQVVGKYVNDTDQMEFESMTHLEMKRTSKGESNSIENQSSCTCPVVQLLPQQPALDTARYDMIGTTDYSNIFHGSDKSQKQLSGLGQRIMSFILAQLESTNEPLYYRSLLSVIPHLILWRSTFLTHNTLLLKYSSMDKITKKADGSNSLVVYIIYNIHTTKVLNILTNTRYDMLQFIQEESALHTFNFKNQMCFDTNATNNCHALYSLYMTAYSVTKARVGGPLAAIKRVTNHFPLYLQHTSKSPFFDQTLFSTDEKMIGKSVKWWQRSEHVKFFSRETKGKLFELGGWGEKQCYYLFHPTDPFCICVCSSGKVWFNVL